MDTIQLIPNVSFKRTFQNPQRFFFKPSDSAEAVYPLLVSYLEWLRKINAALNQFDVMHLNEQKKRKFNFLCKTNFLFYLLATKQFNVIEKWFKTPSFDNLILLRGLTAKENHKTCPKKKKSLPIVKWDGTKSDKNTRKLSFGPYLPYGCPEKLAGLRQIVKAVHRKNNLETLIKRALFSGATRNPSALKNSMLPHYLKNRIQTAKTLKFFSLAASHPLEGLKKSDILHLYPQLIPELKEGGTEDMITWMETREGEVNPNEQEGKSSDFHAGGSLLENMDAPLNGFSRTQPQADIKESPLMRQQLTFFSTYYPVKEETVRQFYFAETNKTGFEI